MTPLPHTAAPAQELIAALESAMEQLRALTAGDDEGFLEGLPEHQAICVALQSVTLGPDDRAALEQLIALNNQIMATLDAVQDSLRVQMAKSRTGARATSAYLS